MAFKPIARLEVWRTLLDGQQTQVGQLAQNRQGVFFQYNTDYLKNYSNLSPFGLKFNTALQPAPTQPHSGLHGVFADSLPDGWGLLLQDRTFRQHGISPNQITAMDRLAFVGNSATGALSFRPASDIAQAQHDELSLHTLGLEAQAVFDGQTDEVLAALAAAGSSGGARPKAQVYFPPNQVQACSTQPSSGDDAWIVKFTSSNLALGHEEGQCEAAYLSLAMQAGLTPPEWQLVDAPSQSGAGQWLAIKRFDWKNSTQKSTTGRLHMHSACGLLDADFRSPSLDYEDLIKATSMVCQSPAAGQLQFKRMIFNLFACNHDDHSKNWAFLQNDKGAWQPAPFYDITFSPHPYGEHTTAFQGFGKKPPLKTIQALATAASLPSWKQARQYIVEVADTLADFEKTAKSLGVKTTTRKLISQQLNATFKENKGLLQD